MGGGGGGGGVGWGGGCFSLFESSFFWMQVLRASESIHEQIANPGPNVRNLPEIFDYFTKDLGIEIEVENHHM